MLYHDLVNVSNDVYQRVVVMMMMTIQVLIDLDQVLCIQILDRLFIHHRTKAMVKAIVIHRDQLLSDSYRVQLVQLTKGFSTSDGFTANDVAKQLSLSVWIAKRLIKRAHDEGILERRGNSRATRYRFPLPFAKTG